MSWHGILTPFHDSLESNLQMLSCGQKELFILVGYFHVKRHFVRAKLLQLCLTVCDPMNCSSPGASVHWIHRQEYWSGPPPGGLPNPGFDRQALYY